MALIKCAECGREVSDKAQACPGCGAPLGESMRSGVGESGEPVVVTRGGRFWEGWGFVLIVAGIFVGLATGPDNHVGAAFGIVGFVMFIVGRFN